MNGINRVYRSTLLGRKELKMAKNTVNHWRSAKTGRYVKEEYAKKHPDTTVKESDKKKSPTKK
jgi:hypothetical protein